jgi:mannose-6-phosphate isomerase-like protein (cupin superfamily)
MRHRHYDLETIPWSPVRPTLTRGIEGKDLLPEGMSAQKAVWTRVSPQGEFPPHCDSYHHVLLVLEGRGEGSVGEEIFPLQPGAVVEIPAGERHSYRNTGEGDLLLITLNISAK